MGSFVCFSDFIFIKNIRIKPVLAVVWEII